MFNPQTAIEPYVATDQDVTGDPQYFGFTDTEGNWYILEFNVANGTLRYIKGRDDTTKYTVNWTARATLTYDYYYNVW